MKRIGTEDHDLPLKELITDVFYQAKERYGYKRITDKLNNVGIVINHKKSL